MRRVLTLSRSFGKFVPVGKEILQKNGYRLIFPPEDLNLHDEKSVSDLIKESNFDAVIAGATKVTPMIIDACKMLRIISKHGVGVDNIDVNYATQKNVVVTYSPNSNIESVAELTVGLILNLSRKISESCLSLKSGKWEVLLGQEVLGKTIGIIGTGKIGKAVIKKLGCFSVKIFANDIFKDQEIENLKYVKYADINDIFSNSDYISLHLPLNKSTYKLVGEDKLNLMKPSAYLINTSRGAIIDEEALYGVLASKRIAGAALDVWESEPPTLMSKKLVKLDNVLATPHIGAYTREALYCTGFECASAIVDFFNGKKPKYLVNPGILKIK